VNADGEYWRYLANMIEPSTCGSDAAFCQNYFDHLLVLYNSNIINTQADTCQIKIAKSADRLSMFKMRTAEEGHC